MRTLLLTISAATLVLLAGVTTGQTAGAKLPPEHPTLHGNRSGENRSTFRMRNSNDVVMYLLGTTPIKNWKMTAHGLQGDAEMVFTNSNRLQAIDGLTFSLPVHNLKGEQSAMDEDAYKALKADKYKDITFTLSSASIESCGTDRSYNVKALGKLTVAGVSRTVTLSMRSIIESDGSVTFSGSEVVRMSDYNVERPSLMLGVIKAGDEMTLTYKLNFTK